MPRCYCCNEDLTDEEATRKSTTTNQFLDMCDNCFGEVADTFIDIEDEENLRELEQEEKENRLDHF